MTDFTLNFVVEILYEYEERTGLSCFVIANKMGIEPSNYYKYREGEGNPTGKTIDKIVGIILTEHPDIIGRALEKRAKIVRATMDLVKST